MCMALFLRIMMTFDVSRPPMCYSDKGFQEGVEDMKAALAARDALQSPIKLGEMLSIFMLAHPMM